MTTYRNIHGRSIQALSTDPTESVAEGQIWYNTTSDTFKSIVSIEAMTSATPMINTRGQNGSAHNGTQNAALSVTGNNNGGGSNLVTNTSEEYNGSGWTAGGTYPISSFGSYGSGVQTAALFSGGRTGSPPFPVTNTSASYNGTSFGAEGNLSTERQSAGCFGATENTSIAAGGHNAPGSPANYTDTEEYNGSAWTTVPATFPSQDNMGAAGVQTAAIANANGGTGTFLFDGSAWTNGPSMNTARSSLNQAMMGLTQDAVVALGANPSANNAIENYDGTSWTTSTATLGTGRSQSASSGSNTAGVLFGGTTTAYVAVTEEYNKSTNVITAAAWSSGGNLNTARSALFGAGTQTAGLAFGGNGATAFLTVTEEYDGSSWTEVNDLSSGQSDGASFGTQTAALGAGGTPPPSGGVSTTQEYDGTNWTSGGALNTGRRGVRGAGILTSGVAAGGSTSPSVESSATEEYNGSSWTSVTSMPSTRKNLVMFGIQTAALGAGGYGPSIPGPSLNTSVEYDGTNWTAGGNMNTGRRYLGGCGIQTDGLIFAGQVPGKTQATEGYNGTSFSTRPNMVNTAVSSNNAGTAAPSTLALSFGGSTTVNVATTEEFTGETTALNVKTLTQS